MVFLLVTWMIPSDAGAGPDRPSSATRTDAGRLFPWADAGESRVIPADARPGVIARIWRQTSATASWMAIAAFIGVASFATVMLSSIDSFRNPVPSIVIGQTEAH